MEERKKRIIIGVTAAAVVLLVLLLIFWVYQVIAVSARRSRVEELNDQIAYYQQMCEEHRDDLEIYTQNKLWLEMAARELGMYR